MIFGSWSCLDLLDGLTGGETLNRICRKSHFPVARIPVVATDVRDLLVRRSLPLDNEASLYYCRMSRMPSIVWVRLAGISVGKFAV